MGLQYRGEAERFREDLRGRMGESGLVLHPDKTRLIVFGRFAVQNREQRGERKPATFDFALRPQSWSKWKMRDWATIRPLIGGRFHEGVTVHERADCLCPVAGGVGHPGGGGHPHIIYLPLSSSID